MKIGYSVQTTGLGHLTHYTALARLLSDRGHEIVTFTSGPTLPSFFKPIGAKHYHLNGPTLFMSKDRLNYFKTAGYNALHLPEFIKNIFVLRKLIQSEKPDLLVVDYEPFTSNYLRWWRPLVRSFSVDHQSTFISPMFPFSDVDFSLKWITKVFSFAKIRLCVNYVDYGQRESFYCIPPILREEIFHMPVSDDGSILVYHSYSTALDKERLIQGCSSDRKFIFYGYPFGVYKNLTFKPKSDEFLKDLAKCHIYITNCGVESVCEALVLGKKIVCQPVKGQTEQEWNGKILKSFGHVRVVDKMDYKQLDLDGFEPDDPKKIEWLKKGKEYALRYILGENERQFKV